MRSSPTDHGRVARGAVVAALALILGGILASPSMRWPDPGPTPDQVALQRTQAQVNDLKRQLNDANAKLRRARPLEPDLIAQARADDLARQLDDAEAKLAQPHPDDPALVAAATRPRPPVPDFEARARADDLAEQNTQLRADLTRPRPPVDPLANVTATMTKAQIVASRNLFGLTTEQSPFSYAEMDLVEAGLGRRANLVGYFQSWTDQFNAKPIKTAWLHGQVPVLTWEPQQQVGIITDDQPEFSLPRIINGAFDQYLHDYARGVRATGLPVVIRLAHEMNGTWYPWSEWSDRHDQPVNGNAKGDYAKMWRHVHDIFQAEGANDLTIWLWAPNRVNRICNQRPPAAFYPGDQYVDWIGSSGYHRDYTRTVGECDDIAATFDGVFGPTLPLLREAASGKPILLSEVGATEHGDEKPEFIATLFDGLARNPDIIGFAWFSLTVTSGTGDGRITHDWRINSSGPAERAMRDGLVASGIGLPFDNG